MLLIEFFFSRFKNFGFFPDETQIKFAKLRTPQIPGVYCYL